MSVRIGIMSFAHLHAHAYASAINHIEEATLVGIADHDPERARKAADQYGAAAFASYQELIAAGLDAVVIASENVRHRELTELAAGSGLHVMCEKPLATSVEDGQAMIDACRRAGVQLMTAFPCRFSPVAARLKAALEAGQIGKVLAMRGTNRGRCPFGWFVEKDLAGGGAVIDHTVHVTDLMRWLMGAEVKEVYAEITNGIFRKEFDDVGLLTLQFDNGVFATLDSSWSRPSAFPIWGDVTLTVVGEKGTLSADLFAQNLVLYSEKEGGAKWIGWGDDIDLLMVRSFVEAVRDHTPVPITGEDGLSAAAAAFAAYESAAQGAPAAVRYAAA
jgi:predicted dehydrogenase